MKKLIQTFIPIVLLCVLACCKYREQARLHVGITSSRVDSIVTMNYGCQYSGSDSIDLVNALRRLNTLDSLSRWRPRWVRREELAYSNACRSMIYLYLNPNVHPAVFSNALQEYTRCKTAFQARIRYR